MDANRCTNRTHITREPDALDADAPDAFYQQSVWNAMAVTGLTEVNTDTTDHN